MSIELKLKGMMKRLVARVRPGAASRPRCVRVITVNARRLLCGAFELIRDLSCPVLAVVRNLLSRSRVKHKPRSD
jgi:hypothetical protein